MEEDKKSLTGNKPQNQIEFINVHYQNKIFKRPISSKGGKNGQDIES